MILLRRMAHGSIISSLQWAPRNSPAERGSLVRLAAFMRRRHKESTNGGFVLGLFSLHSEKTLILPFRTFGHALGAQQHRFDKAGFGFNFHWRGRWSPPDTL